MTEHQACPQFHETTFYCALPEGHEGDCQSPDEVRIAFLLAQLDATQADTHEGLQADRWKIIGSGRADGLLHHTVQTRGQRDGSVMYAISDGTFVMNRDGEFEYEPIPSSRTDAFIANTRFASIAEAMKVYRAGVSPEATEGTDHA